ncbi:hypothetical protein [Paenibacillus alginolyticus]|uniref:Uncharacterized protein n=2 Tax=Paenibacillus alginolyticus TaxID=59839 RepID=A0ABT4G7E6_9BACL|nr:hypothetical protein [Paenibacillus alginolyticus]MCY9692064.1 hypothetical protein [Paenibacillus alginolyticus]
MSYLNPYIDVNSKSANSVYSLMSQQISSLFEAKQSGTYSSYDIPIYQLIDAKKISPTQYQLKVKKHVKRTLRKNNNITGSIFKETAYTYNVISLNGKCLVESEVPETCYTDLTFTQTMGCSQ